MPEPQTFNQRQLEFFRQAYIAENDRKDKLRNGLAINLGIFTILANILVTLLDGIPKFDRSILFWMFCGMVVIATIAGVVALSFFFRALGFPKGFSYGYIPQTTEIYKFIKAVEDYNSKVPPENRLDAEREFENNLMTNYNGFAARNADCNNRRTRLVFLTIIWSIISAAILLFSLPLFYYLRFQTPSPVQSVDISKPVRIEYEPRPRP
jgi:hypothetical protein